jgi:hypothetical protein
MEDKEKGGIGFECIANLNFQVDGSERMAFEKLSSLSLPLKRQLHQHVLLAHYLARSA